MSEKTRLFIKAREIQTMTHIKGPQLCQQPDWPLSRVQDQGETAGSRLSDLPQRLIAVITLFVDSSRCLLDEISGIQGRKSLLTSDLKDSKTMEYYDN